MKNVYEIVSSIIMSSLSILNI